MYSEKFLFQVFKLTIGLWSIACITSGCATKMWPFGSSDSKSQDADAVDEDKPVTVSVKNKKANATDLEFRQARIWNRLDDLEEQVRVQKEQIKLLEQGLLTGIPPEQLRSAQSKIERKAKSTVQKGEAKPKVGVDEGLSVPPAPILDLPSNISAAPDASTSDSPDSYRVRIQVAKDYFQGSRFGLAVAELAQITRTFGPKAGDGEAKYYLGRSYIGLKEYPTARMELESFIKEFPASPHNGMARLELARAYAGLNLRERARKELAGVAKDFDGQEEGDMAAGELQNMKGTL